jgi:hypothetical protein
VVQKTAKPQRRKRVSSLILTAALLLAPLTTWAISLPSHEPTSLFMNEEPPRIISLPGNVIGVAPHRVDLTPLQGAASRDDPTSAAHASIRRSFYRTYRALAASNTLKRLDPTVPGTSQLPEASSSILLMAGLAFLVTRRRQRSVPSASD